MGVWGKKTHLLTLGLIQNNVSIPIWSEDLDKKGISSTAQRITYLKNVLEAFFLQGLTLLADREYIGWEWFEFILSQEINFVIRLRSGNYKELVNASKGMKYEIMCREAKRKGKKGVSKAVQVNGKTYLFLVVKNSQKDAKEPLLFLLTNLKNAQEACKAYKLRWLIECCFKNLKSNGYNLEDTSLKCPKKIELLMAIVSLVYAIACREGRHLVACMKRQGKKVPKKQYKDGYTTKAVSDFRRGMSYLIDFIQSIEDLCVLIISLFSDSFVRFLKNVQ